MEYLFIILFIYASYLSIEKYVHTGSIFTWRAVSYTHLTLPTKLEV